MVKRWESDGKALGSLLHDEAVVTVPPVIGSSFMPMSHATIKRLLLSRV